MTKISRFTVVWWYKTVYQVLSVVWTNRITTLATRSDIGSHNRLDLIQSLVPPHYVCNGYVLLKVALNTITITISSIKESNWIGWYLFVFHLQKVCSVCIKILSPSHHSVASHNLLSLSIFVYYCYVQWQLHA